MNPISGWVNDGGSDEDKQFALLGILGFAAEQPAYQWQVAKHGHLSLIVIMRSDTMPPKPAFGHHTRWLAKSSGLFGRMGGTD